MFDAFKELSFIKHKSESTNKDIVNLENWKSYFFGGQKRCGLVVENRTRAAVFVTCTISELKLRVSSPNQLTIQNLQFALISIESKKIGFSENKAVKE